MAIQNSVEKTIKNFSSTTSGIWASPVATPYSLTQIGNIIVFNCWGPIDTATTASFITFDAAIDADYRPLADISIPIVIMNNNVQSIGVFSVSSGGTMTVRPGPGGNFAGSGTSGFVNSSAVWTKFTYL